MQMLRMMRSSLEKKNFEDHIESYTGMMSHEFKTPLQTALMLLDVILDKDSADESCLSLLRAIKINL